MKSRPTLPKTQDGDIAYRILMQLLLENPHVRGSTMRTIEELGQKSGYTKVEITGFINALQIAIVPLEVQ